MELKYLYTVKKIVETGSYQSAAAALSYAQSTITFQIKQLEQELSVRLFEKNGHKMELTSQGKEMLPLIDKVLSSVEELICYSGSESEIRGTLTVALPETLVTYQMQPILKAFKEKAPNVRISLQVMNCFSIFEQMANGGISLAIHYDVGSYAQNIVTKRIDSYPLALVCSPELNAGSRDFITPNQKKPLCHIRNDPGALSLKIFHQYLRERNIALDAELEVWSIEAIKRSVMSNLGVAFLPRFTVEEELEKGLLHEIETGIPDTTITAMCAYNKSKWQSPAMKLFLQIVDDFAESVSKKAR